MFQVTSHIHTGYPGMGDVGVSASGTGRVFAAVMLHDQLSSNSHAMLQGVHVLNTNALVSLQYVTPICHVLGRKQAGFLLEECFAWHACQGHFCNIDRHCD